MGPWCSCDRDDLRSRQKDFLLRLVSAIPSSILHIYQKTTLIAHMVHRQTCTNSALSSPPLSPLPSLNLSDSNRSVLKRRHRLWSFFSLILSFQIKGQVVFKLTKSSDGLRQRANNLKCLPRSICVMAELSVSMYVCPCIDLFLL